MSKKVLEHLAKKYSKVREGVGAVMGGNISEKLRRKIQEEKDLEVLKQWGKIALKTETLAQFEEEVLVKANIVIE